MNPSEYTVKELKKEIQNIENVDELNSLLEKEKEKQNRENAKNAIQDILSDLEESEPDMSNTVDKKHYQTLDNGIYRDMWVYCENHEGELMDVSKEALGKARQLMDDYNEKYSEDENVVAVLIGNNIEELAEQTISYGADIAVYYEDSDLSRFIHKPYVEIVSDMARSDGYNWKDYDKPRYFLFPATSNGRDLSSQTLFELSSGLASDCSGLYIEDVEISNPSKTGGGKKTYEKVLHMERPDFSGLEYSTILCLDNPRCEFSPQAASVIPGAFTIPEPIDQKEGKIVEHELELHEEWMDVEVIGYEKMDEGVDLTDKEAVIALGRGIGEDPTEGLELGLELVEAFSNKEVDTDLGLSRGVITASYDVESHVDQYVAEERQIGETGQEISPDLYIAAGISGAIQHVVGIEESETVISINTDSDAPIKDYSDYFIDEDLFEVLPRLTQAVKKGEIKVVER